MTTKQQDQVLWAFGTLERLCNLGMIGCFGYHISDPDKFLEVDERRSDLFQSDKSMAQLVATVCRKECCMTDSEKIMQMIYLVKQYKDDRDALVKVALEHMLSGEL